MRGLKSLFNEAEIQMINTHVNGAGRRHPAWTAMNADESSITYRRSPADYFVNSSVDQIRLAEGGHQWLANVTSRLTCKTDYEAIVSALAEIRCYGALLEAGLSVTPIPTAKKPTPDFSFEIDGQTGIVEVAAKLQDDAQTKRSTAIAMGETPEGVERSTYETEGTKIETVVAAIQPFGAPEVDKEGDTIQTNAISRICSIKQSEKQTDPEGVNILWIDFRDFSDWPSSLKVENAAPIVAGHYGSLTSGAIWYAFYGWKGAPVFDDSRSDTPTIATMQHHGRFHSDNPKQSNYAAAVICLEEATVVLENSAASNQLSDALRCRLTCLPWFNIGHSIVEWSTGHVDQKNGLSGAMINKIRDFHTQSI